MPWLATEGSSFFPAIFAVAFLFLSLALGRRLLILLGARGAASPIEHGVIATGLGAGVLQFVPFALGGLGLLTITNLQIATGVLVLIAAAELRAVALAALAAVRRARMSAWTIAWLVALSPALLMAGLMALAPTIDADGLAYHLTVPKRWMHTGQLDYLPTYPYSNGPMGTQMLFALGMAFAGDVAAKCIHYVLGLVAVAAIYLSGLRLSGRMAGAVPATLFLFGPGAAVTLLGTAYVEGSTALATTGSALAWLIWYQTAHRGYLLSAAVLAGVAVSFKITSALVSVALLALTVVAIVTRDQSEQGAKGIGRSTYLGLRTAASLLPFMAAPVLPWFARAFLITGNPFFPVLAGLIPSRDLPAELAVQVDQYNRYMTWGTAIGRDWTIEQRVWVLLGVAVLLALLGAVAFFKLRGATTRGAVVVLTITGLVQLFAAGLYFRYWLPLSAAMMVPIAASLAPILSRRSVMVAWLGLTLAASLVQAHRCNVAMGSNFMGLVRTVAGLDERADFLRSRLPLHSLHELANRDLPADAGIMLSHYCGAFYIDRRTFCAEMVQTSLRFTTWQEFTEDLRRLRITHVIAPSVLATDTPPPPEFIGGSAVSSITRLAQFQRLAQLLKSHARLVATASDQSLYEIILPEAPRHAVWRKAS